jgi:hypothetical protein
MEHATLRPRRQQAQQVAQVLPRLDAVQATAREQRHEGRVHLRRIVRADEEPVLAPEHLAPELELAPVVVHRQPPVREEALEGGPVPPGIAERLGERRLVEDRRFELVAPLEEARDDRLRLLLAHREALRRRRTVHRALDRKQLADERERLARPLRLRAERLVEVPPQVRPAPDLDHLAARVEVVVDRVRVGDEIALVAREQPVDAGAVVPRRVVEDHVPLGRHQHVKARQT